MSKPIDILDAVPRRQDAMYMLAYLTILTLISKTLSWEKSTIDTHLKHWKESHQNNIDLLSRPMDDITDPVTTSRAYQKLMVSQLTTALAMARSGKEDKEMTAKPTSNVDVLEVLESLRDLRFEASCHKDYLLAMEIYEACEDILPDEYIQATGASEKAIELLHPDVRLTSPSSRSERAVEIKITEEIVTTAATKEETLSALNLHASMLSRQGKYEAAEEKNRRSLKGYEKVLGKEHPDTLTSLSNLAWVLSEQGKYEAADETSRRALEGREKVLGEEHPDTLTSLSNLASVLSKEGKYKAAEEMSRSSGAPSRKNTSLVRLPYNVM